MAEVPHNEPDAAKAPIIPRRVRVLKGFDKVEAEGTRAAEYKLNRAMTFAKLQMKENLAPPTNSKNTFAMIVFLNKLATNWNQYLSKEDRMSLKTTGKYENEYYKENALFVYQSTWGPEHYSFYLDEDANFVADHRDATMHELMR